jgi:hypothetical protein
MTHIIDMNYASIDINKREQERLHSHLAKRQVWHDSLTTHSFLVRSFDSTARGSRAQWKRPVTIQ